MNDWTFDYVFYNCALNQFILMETSIAYPYIPGEKISKTVLYLGLL